MKMLYESSFLYSIFIIYSKIISYLCTYIIFIQIMQVITHTKQVTTGYLYNNDRQRRRTITVQLWSFRPTTEHLLYDVPGSHARLGRLQYPGDELWHPLSMHQGFKALLHGRPGFRFAAQRPDPPAQVHQSDPYRHHQPDRHQWDEPFLKKSNRKLSDHQNTGRP